MLPCLPYIAKHAFLLYASLPSFLKIDEGFRLLTAIDKGCFHQLVLEFLFGLLYPQRVVSQRRLFQPLLDRLPSHRVFGNNQMHNTPCPKKNQATEYHFLLNLHKFVLQLLDWCHRNEGLQAHYTFDQVQN